ncbi:hypothetical protein C8J56DRAFT_881600 [Mycena floridula]|nr:hypothetical protein C8J56DRAFT_881600 [Mycena floridula]
MAAAASMPSAAIQSSAEALEKIFLDEFHVLLTPHLQQNKDLTVKLNREQAKVAILVTALKDVDLQLQSAKKRAESHQSSFQNCQYSLQETGLLRVAENGLTLTEEAVAAFSELKRIVTVLEPTTYQSTAALTPKALLSSILEFSTFLRSFSTSWKDSLSTLEQERTGETDRLETSLKAALRDVSRLSTESDKQKEQLDAFLEQTNGLKTSLKAALQDVSRLSTEKDEQKKEFDATVADLQGSVSKGGIERDVLEKERDELNAELLESSAKHANELKGLKEQIKHLERDAAANLMKSQGLARDLTKAREQCNELKIQQTSSQSRSEAEKATLREQLAAAQARSDEISMELQKVTKTFRDQLKEKDSDRAQHDAALKSLRLKERELQHRVVKLEGDVKANEAEKVALKKEVAVARSAKEDAGEKLRQACQLSEASKAKSEALVKERNIERVEKEKLVSELDLARQQLAASRRTRPASSISSSGLIPPNQVAGLSRLQPSPIPSGAPEPSTANSVTASGSSSSAALDTSGFVKTIRRLRPLPQGRPLSIQGGPQGETIRVVPPSSNAVPGGSKPTVIRRVRPEIASASSDRPVPAVVARGLFGHFNN